MVAVDTGVTGCMRLFDITANAPVADSTACATGTDHPPEPSEYLAQPVLSEPIALGGLRGHKFTAQTRAQGPVPGDYVSVYANPKILIDW